MKKWMIFGLLIALLLTFTACQTGDSTLDNPTEEPTEEPTQGPTLPSYEAAEPVQKDGVYQITEPAHLTYLAQHPDKAYALADDIDMYGYTWIPVEDFSGSLSGLIAGDFNYTISNLVIEAKEGDTNVGFFRTLSGTLSDVNFYNITVTCSGTITGNLGVVAGTATSAMTDVEVKNSTLTATVKDANVGLLCGKAEKNLNSGYAAGTLKVTLAGGTSYVGGGLGYTEGSVSNSEIRTDITVSGTGTAGAVGGMTGYAKDAISFGYYIGHLTVTTDDTFAAGTLAGEAVAGITSSYNCARSFTRTGAVTADTYCGKKAADTKVEKCVTRDNSNIEDTLSEAERAMRQKVVDYAYQMATYRWIPSKTIAYSDSCGGGGRHNQTYTAGTIYFGMPYTHYSSSYAKFLYYLDENHVLSADLGEGNSALQTIGNDCADFVFWAWNQVEADINFALTGEAICANGVQPVGTYFPNSIVSTKDVIAHNGAQVMYESYAKAQMGDALLYNHGSGHFRLVAEAAYVFRNADGSIDPNKSYIVTHEQGASFGGRTTCKVNGRFSFAALYSTNYIPVTIEAYAKGEADVLTAEISNKNLDKSGIGTGIIKSNYQIDKVTMRILNSKGKVIVDEERHGCASAVVRAFAMSKFRDAVKEMQLEAGKEYTYEVYIENGGQKICVQTYKFTA